MATGTAQPGYRVRALPRFPARVEVGDGLSLARANGVYTFALGFSTLLPATSITDPDTIFIPAWDSEADSYSRLSASALGQTLSGSLSGISTSSVAVGTGSKSFTASTGRAWVAGQRLRIASDDDAKVMSGPVASYDPTTGALVVTVDYTLGSGSHADWNITIGGERGPQGTAGLGTGDVVGPSSAGDGHFALFDTGTGKLLKDSAGAPGALAYLSTISASQIDAAAVTYAKFQNLDALSIFGRGANSAGVGASIAAGTDGHVLRRSGTTLAFGTIPSTSVTGLGTAAVLDVGTTASKIVQLDGSARLPAVDGSQLTGLPATGALVLIESQFANNSATLDFTTGLNDIYDGFVFVLTDVAPATDNVTFAMRVGTGAGPTWQTSGYIWGATYVSSASSSGNYGSTGGGGSTVRIELGVSLGNASGESYSGEVRFSNPDDVGFHHFACRASWGIEDGAIGMWACAGRYNTVGAITGIRFFMTSGNIAFGRISLYGYRKA